MSYFISKELLPDLIIQTYQKRRALNYDTDRKYQWKHEKSDSVSLCSYFFVKISTLGSHYNVML